MEKEIILENDSVFKNSVEYKDCVFYKMITPKNSPIDMSIEEDAHEVKDVIHELIMHGKLTAVDLNIIKMRDCSPMPTMRELSVSLKISLGTVHSRIEHIKRLMPIGLRRKYK